MSFWEGGGGEGGREEEAAKHALRASERREEGEGDDEDGRDRGETRLRRRRRRRRRRTRLLDLYIGTSRLTKRVRRASASGCVGRSGTVYRIEDTEGAPDENPSVSCGVRLKR